MTIEYHIHLGDCRDLWTLVPECHLMACDPPYSKHVHANAVSAGMIQYGIGPHQRDFGFEHLTYSLRAYIAQCANAVQGWSLIYSDVESVNVWRHAVRARGAEYIRPLPWVRWSQPQKSGDRPPTGCEIVSVYHRMPGTKPVRKRWSGPGSLIELAHEVEEPALRHKALRGRNDVDKHSAEKPLDQALDLVSWFSKPGETVFDPTCGAGTFALAAAILGRGFLGAEKDDRWHAYAVNRVKQFQDSRVLSNRDWERFARWADKTKAEALKVPEPKDKSQLRTWERAQRRLVDLDFALRAV